MPIELSNYLLDKATEVAHEMSTKGLTEATIPDLAAFFVSTDKSAKAYLGSITVEGAKYFICQRMYF